MLSHSVLLPLCLARFLDSFDSLGTTKRIRRPIAITAKVAVSQKGSDLKGFRLVPSILSPLEDALMTFLVPFPVSSSAVSIGGETLPKVSVRSSESCDSA